MSVTLQKTVSEHGYALVVQHRPELEIVKAISLLGSVLTLNGFSTVQELRPHAKASAAPNIYSGNFGMGEFPMHTDLAHWAVPPRYLALRCIRGTSAVATSSFDGNVMIDDIGPTSLRRTSLV